MKTIDFVGKRKIFFGIPIALIILGIIGLFIVGGPTLSIDYQGGAVIEIGLPTNDFSLSEIETLIQDLTGKNVTVQKSEYDYDISDENQNVYKKMVKLDIRIQTNEQLTDEETKKVSSYLISKFGNITVPEPAYYEAKAPYVAHYEMDCSAIPTDNETEYSKIMTEVQDELRELLSTDEETKRVGTDFSYIYGPDDLVVKKYMVNVKVASTDRILTDDEISAIKNAVGEKFDIVVSENPVDYNFSNVSPSVGREMLKDGLIAILIASVFMIIYIWIRFKAISGLSAGVMSFAALLHDVVIMFLVYCIFNFTINESFIAAVLTILGYSINNTIVVFDRIRENMGADRSRSIKDTVNLSIRQTFKRCIITTLCVLSSLIILYIFASANALSTIVEFAFPLIIGNICGFYSSVFIAPNLWALYKEKKTGKA